MKGKKSEYSVVIQGLMLWRLCSNFMASSWQRRRAMLSQRWKLTSVQLSFSTVPQRCDNVAVQAGKPFSTMQIKWQLNLLLSFGDSFLIDCHSIPLLFTEMLLKSSQILNWTWSNSECNTLSHTEPLPSKTTEKAFQKMQQAFEFVNKLFTNYI